MFDLSLHFRLFGIELVDLLGGTGEGTENVTATVVVVVAGGGVRIGLVVAGGGGDLRTTAIVVCR